MELENIQKHDLGNAKQEDKKTALALIKTLSLMDDEDELDFSDESTRVKQEEMKNGNSLLKQNVEPSQSEYYYKCFICNEEMENLRSVLEHRKSIHKDVRTRHARVKNIDVEPDIHDPKRYCKSCERSYVGRDHLGRFAYERHLKGVHHMVLKSIPSRKTPQNITVPAPAPVDPTLLAEDIANIRSQKSTYCRTCNRGFARKYSYQRHLFNVHKVDWRLKHQRPKGIMPYVDDPNFYCRSCDKTLATKKTYTFHLKVIHSIFQSAPRKKSNLEPEINDPNNYCRACQKPHLSRSSYRSHLLSVHQIVLPSLRVNVSIGDLPDPYDPHHYCCVCKKTSISFKRYRRHCKMVHFMLLNHSSIANPEATVDVNDPNFYCAQCKHKYCNKRVFKRHLGTVHNI